MTDSGLVNPERVQLIMQDLGEMEDEIFKERQSRELSFRARNKANKRRANFQNFLFPPEAKTLARGLYSLTISNWDGDVKVIQLRRKMSQFKRWIAAYVDQVSK